VSSGGKQSRRSGVTIGGEPINRKNQRIFAAAGRNNVRLWEKKNRGTAIFRFARSKRESKWQ
jgi:hypothetical protein